MIPSCFTHLLKHPMVIPVIIVMITGISLIGSASESSEYTTIVLTEDTLYHIGDNVTIEVRFFHLDVVQDAHDLNLTLGDPPEDARYIEPNMTEARVEEGVYRFSFPILEEDKLDGKESLNGTVRCSLDDARGTQSDSSDFVLFLVGEDVKVSVATDRPHFEAGETVRFSVETTLNGMPFVPDSVDAVLTINDRETYPSLVDDETGTYHFDYQDPGDSASKNLVFSVTAERNGSSYSSYVLSILDYYQLWFDVSENVDGGILGILGVADQSGRAIDADVNLSYHYRNELGNITTRTQNNLRCVDGIIELELPFSDIAFNERDITLEIWANGSDGRGEDHQQFKREPLRVSRPPFPAGNGFEVIYQENITPIPRSSQENLLFRAFEDGESLNDTEIYYYLSTGSKNVQEENRSGEFGEMLTKGNATTDENGQFSISLDTPNAYTGMVSKFKYLPDTGRYGEGDWREFIHDSILIGSPLYIKEDVGIEVTDFVIGDYISINVTEPGHSSANGVIEVIPIEKPITESGLDEQLFSTSHIGWHRLNILDPALWESYSDSPFSQDVGIPEFFPGDGNFLILVTTWNVSHPSSPLIRGYLTVDHKGNEVDPFEIELSIDAEIPDDIQADSMKPITIQIVSNGSLEGVKVTLETTDLLDTCKSQAITDHTGTVYCLIQSANFTGEDGTATIWINATKDGYSDAYLQKEIIIHAWEPPKELTLTTNLPDILGSAETRPMLITVTSEGKPVQTVRVTIQTVGSGRTCKEAGNTDAQGLVSCAVFADHVIGKNSSVTIFLNGTKAGYQTVRYQKTIVIVSLNAPDELIEPITLQLGEGMNATIRASIIGELGINAALTNAPDAGDDHAVGVYVNINMNGTGSLRWLNITITYSSLPAGFNEEKMKIFFWDTTRSRWMLATNTGTDPDSRIIYANVTHLTLFAPRELDDITPPLIEHTAIKRADPDTNITIRATITDQGNVVQTVTLYYRNVGDSIYKIINMESQGDEFSAVIPSYNVKRDQTIEYFIRANDGFNTATHPEDSSIPHLIEIREEDSSGGFIPGFGFLLFLCSMSLSILLRRPAVVRAGKRRKPGKP